MPRWIRLNGLSVVMFGAFLVFLVLQSVFGWHVRNEELAVRPGRRASWPTWAPGTSSRRSSRTGNPSSCRWARTCCSPRSWCSGVRRSPSRSTRRTGGEDNPRPGRRPTPRAGPPWRLGPRCTATACPSRSWRSSRGRSWRTCSAAPPSTTSSRPCSPARRRSARGVPGHQRVLVPVHAELAERVPRGRRADRAEHLPAPAGVRRSPNRSPSHTPRPAAEPVVAPLFCRATDGRVASHLPEWPSAARFGNAVRRDHPSRS